MELKVIKTDLKGVQDLRILFLEERKFQFVLNKCHDYGWADTYLFVIDDVKIGYGSVWGSQQRTDRDTIFEFYILESYLKFAQLVFLRLQMSSGAIYIECQSNDQLLASMLYEYASDINTEAILFQDRLKTGYFIPGIVFRKADDSDQMGEDDSDYVLVLKDEIVASGGLMLNYNPPYADVYMQVKSAFLHRGFGSLMVQELKKLAYETGRVPAARCNINNPISRATLVKAGFEVCGYRLKGKVKSLS